MILLATCLLGLFLAYEERINAFLLLFCFSLFLMPLLVYKMEPMWFQYRGYVPVILTGFLFLCNADKLAKNKAFRQNISFLAILIILFLITLAICSAINNYDILKGILYFKHYFWAFLLYDILVSLRYKNLKIRKAVELLMIVQIVVAIIQYIGGDSFSKSLYFWEMVKDGNQVALSSESLKTVKGVLISGTLGKVTVLGNTLAICLTYWFGSKLSEGEHFGLWDFLLMALTIAVIISTGTRASFLTSMIGLILCFIFITNRDHRFNKIISKIIIIGILSLIFLPTFIFIGHEAIRSSANYGEGFYRSMSLFGIFDDLLVNNGSSQIYTLQRSVNILAFFNLESILWGRGIYMNNVQGYGSGIASISDVQLMFVLVEFGLIILFLCMTTHFFCLRDLRLIGNKSTYITCLIVFLVLLCQTIVDDGIFNMPLSFLTFIIYANEGVNHITQTEQKTT